MARANWPLVASPPDDSTENHLLGGSARPVLFRRMLVDIAEQLVQQRPPRSDQREARIVYSFREQPAFPNPTNLRNLWTTIPARRSLSYDERKRAHLAKFVRALVPRRAAVVAPVEVSVDRRAENEVRIVGMRCDGPNRAVRRWAGQSGLPPCLAAIVRDLKCAGSTRWPVAVPKKEYPRIVRPGCQSAAVGKWKQLVNMLWLPCFAVVATDVKVVVGCSENGPRAGQDGEIVDIR